MPFGDMLIVTAIFLAFATFAVVLAGVTWYAQGKPSGHVAHRKGTNETHGAHFPYLKAELD